MIVLSCVLPLASRRDLSCVQIAHELQVLRELNCSYELKPPPVTGRSSPMRRVAKPPSSRHGHRKGRRSAIETEPQTAGPEAAEILNLDPSTGSNASAAGQPSGGGAADKWQRSAGLPSWNSCFRCDFSYCNGYNGAHACLPARVAWVGVGCRGGGKVYSVASEHAWGIKRVHQSLGALQVLSSAPKAQPGAAQIGWLLWLYS